MRSPFLLFVLVSCAWSQQSFVVTNVRLFDGDRVIARANVVVENGRIAAAGAAAQIPKGIREIDGTGKTLLPGLIDAHTHAFADGALKQSAVFGVTTDLDMFSSPDFVAGIKKQKAAGQLQDNADLFSAGILATAPGGHGTEYGIKVPTLTAPGEAQAWVDARVAEGSDYIKIVYDDALEYGFAARPTLSKETMKAVIDAAHKRGKLAVVHIGSLQQAEDAINAGADALVHLFVGATEPDFGKLAAAHHVFVIPTMSVLNTICATSYDGDLADDPRLKPYLLQDQFTAMKGTFPTKNIKCDGAAEAVKQLKAAKVPILAGTDAGNPGTTYGASLHGEMELLVRAGLTPVEALHAATAAPVAAFHLTGRGHIASGMNADMVLVNGDPTTDITATRQIAAVWKNGVEIDRAAWKTEIERKRAAASTAKSAAPPPGSESGWISDFEQEGAPKARFGTGWSVTTDQIAGGKSEAAMEVVAGGANGSKGALAVKGEIREGFAQPWAGVMFLPSASPTQPANLSSKKAIRFWAKGDGQSYRLMIFVNSFGSQPLLKNFAAGAEWKEVVIPFDSMGVDAKAIVAMIWCAGDPSKAFEFRIDDVKLD